jgi:hypothetical protein
VLDDASPLKEDVKSLCDSLGVKYVPATLKPGDTKNGLAESLSLAPWDEPIFAVCDDAVFGRGIVEEIQHIMKEEVPPIQGNWGMISLFACYARNAPLREGSHLWEYLIRAFYAGIAVIYSPAFRKAYYNDWNQVANGLLPMPQMCDDIYCKDILNAMDLKLYNTIQDFAQHTGVDARTFGGNEADPGSRYISQFFVGE